MVGGGGGGDQINCIVTQTKSTLPPPDGSLKIKDSHI